MALTPLTSAQKAALGLPDWVDAQDGGDGRIWLKNVSTRQAREFGANEIKGEYDNTRNDLGERIAKRAVIVTNPNWKAKYAAEDKGPDDYAAYGAAQNIGKPAFNQLKSEGFKTVEPDYLTLKKRVESSPEQAAIVEKATTRQVIRQSRATYTEPIDVWRERTAGDIIQESRARKLSLEETRQLALRTSQQARLTEADLRKEKYVTISRPTTISYETTETKPEVSTIPSERLMTAQEYKDKYLTIRSREAEFGKSESYASNLLMGLKEMSERSAQNVEGLKGFPRYFEAGKAFAFGYGYGVASTFTGIYQTIRHPIQTTKGFISLVSSPFETGASFTSAIQRNPAGVLGQAAGYATTSYFLKKASSKIQSEVKTSEIKSSQAKIGKAQTVRYAFDNKVVDYTQLEYQLVSKSDKVIAKGKGAGVLLTLNVDDTSSLSRGFVTFVKPKITDTGVVVNKRIDIAAVTSIKPSTTQSFVFTKAYPRGARSVNLIKTVTPTEGVTKSIGFEYPQRLGVSLAQSKVKGVSLGTSREVLSVSMGGGTKSVIQSAFIGTGKKGAEAILANYDKIQKSYRPTGYVSPTPTQTVSPIAAQQLQLAVLQDIKKLVNTPVKVETTAKPLPTQISTQKPIPSTDERISYFPTTQKKTTTVTFEPGQISNVREITTPFTDLDLGLVQTPQSRRKVSLGIASIGTTRQDNNSRSSLITSTTSVSDVIQGVENITTQKPAQSQKSKTSVIQIQKPVSLPRTVTRYTPSPKPFIFPEFEIKPVGLRGSEIPSFEYIPKNSSFNILGTQKSTLGKYQPSLYSKNFNIWSNKTPETVTGLGLRPLIKGGDVSFTNNPSVGMLFSPGNISPSNQFIKLKKGTSWRGVI